MMMIANPSATSHLKDSSSAAIEVKEQLDDLRLCFDCIAMLTDKAVASISIRWHSGIVFWSKSVNLRCDFLEFAEGF